MLEKYKTAIHALGTEDKVYLMDHFRVGGCNPEVPDLLWELLDSAGLCQADVLYALMRGDRLSALTQLGVTVTTLPPAPSVEPPDLRRLQQLFDAVPPAGDQRRVVRVNPNVKGTVLLSTLVDTVRERFRVGDTVAALLARGVPLKTIRRAADRGLIELTP